MTDSELVLTIARSKSENVRESLKSYFKGEHLTIAFTGALTDIGTRHDVIEWFERYFEKVEAKPTITKDTNVLIVGDKPGSKLGRAQKMGIKMWNEQDLRSLITAACKSKEVK